MKLLFLIPSLGQGGAEKVLVNLVNNLDTSKFDITVQTLFDEGENKHFLKPYIHYKSYMKHQFKGNTYFFKLFSPNYLYKRIIKEHYDIIISYLEGPTARIVSGCNESNTKLVSWIHSTTKDSKSFSHSFRNYKEAINCYKKYDINVMVSKGVEKSFKKFFKNDLNTVVLYNTNESDLIIEKSKENIDIDIDNNYINICAIGTLKEVKGFDRLIRIIERLKNGQLKVKIYILGKGPLEKQLKNQVKELNLEEYVVFLGYQINPYKYISKMDIFTCSSYSEGFSTAATEALILGIPVVTVLVSGMQEMLGYNNEYGIVTKNDEDQLYQALKDMILNEKKLEYYTLMAKERGTFFSTKNTVSSVEKMFLKL